MAQTDLWNRESQRSVPLWLIIAAVVLLAARIVSTQFADEEGDTLVRWVPLDEAHDRAAAENKPILYDFTAEWCGPCRTLEAEVFSDPQLAKRINAKFVPVRVMDRQREEGTNSARVQELQDLYTVRGFPTLVIADAAGAAQEKMEGFRGRDAFIQMMESVR